MLFSGIWNISTPCVPPILPPTHLGVAGFLDTQVSRRQVTGDRDAKLLR